MNTHEEEKKGGKEIPAPMPETKGKPLEEAFAAFLSSLSEGDRAGVAAMLTEAKKARAAHVAAARAAEEEAVIAEMEKADAFSDIRTRREAIEALCSHIYWLGALPLRERLATALYLDRGMRLHEPSAEEKLAAVLSDPALLRALAEKQAEEQAARASLLPPAHTLGTRMPANLKKPPKNLAEAEEAAKHYFKIRK